MGIALASGAPLFSGIIAGIVGGIIVGIASGSSLGVSGPAAGLAVIVLTSIATLGSWPAFLLAVVIAGFIQLALGFAKAGFIAYFFPSSVIKGMLTGIGLLIILKQMATGLIASSSITHATPAAFIAHVAGREDKEGIAVAFLDTPIDLFIGGGLDYFSRRKTDERDIVTELTAKGYRITNFIDQDIQQLDITTDKNIGYFTANAEPLPVSQGRDYLLPATTKALDFLDERSPNGFFLMIEGSQIDWGGHSNDANYVINEMHDFEKIVAAALDFAARDQSTA